MPHKKILPSLLFLIVLFPLFWGWKSPVTSNEASESTRKWILSELNGTTMQLSHSLSSLKDPEHLRSLYHAARKQYKHIEFFIEYCSPREAKYFINGPLVPKHDMEMGSTVHYPCGFQRIEELLFDKQNELDTATLRTEYTALLAQLSRIGNYYQTIEISDGQLLEMCQQQLFRIAAMNLNGYDATLTQTNVLESSWCLEGIEHVVKAYTLYTDRDKQIKISHALLLKQLSIAKKYLRARPAYNTFDRLEFIIHHINPLNNSMVAFHNTCGLPWDQRKQAIKLQQGFLFGKESFNTQYFSIYYDDTLHIEQQAQLGHLLFFDPVLSGNNERSCASCHSPSKAFSDPYSASLSFDGKSKLSRNAPGLLNVCYQKSFFHDGRAYELEQQIFDVLHNVNEMQSPLEEIVLKLRQSTKYRILFSQAFTGTRDSLITVYSIQKALAEYEKTLVSFNSRFDQYLRGDLTKLTKQEKNGYNVFAGKALCGSCHFLPLFNGTGPPFFSDSEFEVIGTPLDSNNKQLDTDAGRYAVTRIEEQMHSFKTPTVRNIELTGPYMHNGIYTSLEQLVAFYQRGGGAGFKLKVPNQTLPFDSLELTNGEKKDLVLFLKALTDTSGTTKKPSVLPYFEGNPVLNNRKPGGKY